MKTRFFKNPKKFLKERVSIDQSGCWNWKLYTRKDGYGQITTKQGVDVAHRTAYMVFIGEIPNDLVVDHLCRNRKCINPKHVELVSRGENVLRGETGAGINSRKKVCLNGHPFSKENTYIRVQKKNGKLARNCKACRKNRV